MKSPVLVLDCNYLCYVSYHVLGDLTFGGQGTGCVFGFLRQVLQLAGKFGTKKFVFCWDHPHNLRREEYPGYKKSRRVEKSPEDEARDHEARRQFRIVRTQVLPELGFQNIFYEDGYEADDLIDAAVQTISEYGDNVVFVSADEDLYQLLGQADMYNLRSKKLLSGTWFEKEWGIPPGAWTEAKAIAGCPSDEVVGIRGVGLKTAISYLQGSLKSEAKNKLIRESSTIIERNRGLVALRGSDFVPLEMREDVFSKKEFIKVFDRMDFRSFLTPDGFAKWINLLGLR